MNWGAIGAVAELLGAAGVIVSLVYLANQVRAAGELGQQEAARSVLAKLNSAMEYLASSHEKSDMWVRGSSGLANLKDEAEVVQFSAFLTTFFRTYEELYIYQKAGVEWDWEGVEAQVRATLGAPGVREWWPTRNHFLSAEVRDHLSPYVEGSATPLYGAGGHYDKRKSVSTREEGMSSTDVVTRLYDAFGRGDIPTVLELFHSEIQWHEAEGSPYHPGPEGWVGPDAIVSNLFEKMGADWTEFAVHPKAFHDSGDVVTVEVRYAATHAVTGRILDAQSCHVWTVNDGKITSFQQYMDTAQMENVMGARAS